MTIPVLPDYTAPFKPVPQVAPLTIRDGDTMLRKVEGIKKYLTRVLVPWINENYAALADDFEEEVTRLIDVVNAAIELVISNSVEVQDPVVAGIFNDPGSDTRAVTDAFYAAKSAVDAIVETINNGRLSQSELDARYVKKTGTFNVLDYGAIGNGTADDSAAIALTVAAATENGRIVFPNGTYKISTTITNGGKALDFDARNAKFIKDGDFTSVALSGTFDAFVGVTSISASTITEGDDTVNVVIIGTENAMPWARGDVVKIISDDVIPGSRDEGNGSPLQGRLGQFFTVYSISGLTATLTGVQVDTFTTAIRVGRLQNKPVSWVGGSFDVSSTHLANAYQSRTLVIENLHSAHVEGVEIIKTTSVGISVIGCFAPTVEDVRVRWALNSIANGGLGYAVSNFSSQGLRLNRLYANTVRSGFTDGHAFLPVASNDYAGYGRPMFSHISNCVIDSPTNTGIGTHTSGAFNSFTDCTVTNARFAVALRGRENVVNGLKAVNISNAAVRIFSEINGQSYGHTVNNVSINGAEDAIEIYVNDIENTAHFNERELRSVHISNVHGRGIKRHGLKLHNIVANIENIDITFVGARGVSANVFDNTYIRGANWQFDVDGITTNGALSIFQVSATPESIFEVSNITVHGDVTRTFTKLFHNSAGQIIRARNIMLANRPSSSFVDTLTTDSFVDYSMLIANESSSSYKVASTANMTDTVFLAALMNSREPIISVAVSLSGNTTLGTMPVPPRRGAMILFTNTSAFTLTVNNGGNMATASGAAKVVPAGGSILLLGVTGGWREISF
jgi:hypothetical protein